MAGHLAMVPVRWAGAWPDRWLLRAGQDDLAQMKPAWWMVGAAVGSWLALAAVPDSDIDVLLGMMAPLAGAVATWVLVTRTYARRPELLTPLMIATFGGKLVFF